ncbi:MAG TPA: hypothetical protein VIC03_02925, partial [Gemmatimonadaceae bacterium]
KPVVRAANTGISGWIDPLGRVRAETPIFVPRSATYTVEVTTTRTLYTRLGDWVGALCLVVTLGLLLVSWRSTRQRRQLKNQ